jgi:hypothetical protein
MLESVPKWIISSIAHHFDSHRDGVSMHVEGTKRKDPVGSTWFELRFDGPDRAWIDRDVYRFSITINCSVTAMANEEDAYLLFKTCGLVAKAFTNSIPVYKFGTAGSDDQSLIGCLTVKDSILTNIFGQDESADDQVLAEVQGHYELDLTIVGE